MINNLPLYSIHSKLQHYNDKNIAVDLGSAVISLDLSIFLVGYLLFCVPYRVIKVNNKLCGHKTEKRTFHCFQIKYVRFYCTCKFQLLPILHTEDLLKWRNFECMCTLSWPNQTHNQQMATVTATTIEYFRVFGYSTCSYAKLFADMHVYFWVCCYCCCCCCCSSPFAHKVSIFKIVRIAISFNPQSYQYSLSQTV